MNSDLAREENSSRSASGILGTGGAPPPAARRPGRTPRGRPARRRRPRCRRRPPWRRRARGWRRPTPPVAPQRAQRALHGRRPAPPSAHVAQRPEVGSEVGGRLRVEERHELLGQRPAHDAVAPAARADREQPQLQGRVRGVGRRVAPLARGTRRRPRRRRPTTVTSKAPIATATSREALAGPAE